MAGVNFMAGDKDDDPDDVNQATDEIADEHNSFTETHASLVHVPEEETGQVTINYLQQKDSKVQNFSKTIESKF